MATTTTNFGWDIPQSSDLVKNGATAIAELGQDIDTSMAGLKGGTTGQVLSKTSNTDMAFTWVAQDDSNAIQNAIVDAKGDLIAATANDTPARLAVGNNGETLVADSSTATGLRWQGNYAAGKNAIQNGDFYINQRNFTSNAVNRGFGFDRWANEFSGGSSTQTAQTFTAGTAPVAGYEFANYLRITTASQSASGDYAMLTQRIENVRTYANQVVTMSFWAKAASGTPKISFEFQQNFGTGGSPSAQVNTYAGQATLSTSWTRYTITATCPSISGYTIGTTANTSFLGINFWLSAGSTFNSRSGSIGIQNATFDIVGIQLEAGSVATAFQTATGTIQGELAACQRYYFRTTASAAYSSLTVTGQGNTTTIADCMLPVPVTMRTYPTSVDYANVALSDEVAGTFTGGTLSISGSVYSNQYIPIRYTHGSAALTTYRVYKIIANNNSSAYLGVSAEL